MNVAIEPSSSKILEVSFEYTSLNSGAIPEAKGLIYRSVFVVCPNSSISVVSKIPVLKLTIFSRTEFDLREAAETLNGAKLNNLGKISCKLLNSPLKMDVLPVLERLTFEHFDQNKQCSKSNTGGQFVQNYEAGWPGEQIKENTVKSGLIRPFFGHNNLEIQKESPLSLNCLDALLPRTSTNSPTTPLCGQITQTRVVIISNLNNFFDSADQILNLCVNFGGIKGLVYMSNRQIALVEFTSETAVDRCLENINLRTDIEFKFHATRSSKYMGVNREANPAKIKSEKFNEYIFPTNGPIIEKEFHHRGISEKVLVFCVETQNEGHELVEVSMNSVYKVLEMYGEIDSFLKQVNVTRQFKGYVFRMKDLLTAVRVVSKLHRKSMGSLVWEVTFYNSKKRRDQIFD